MKKCFLLSLLISMVLSVLTPVYGQKKDTLFWYVGTWKNKTLFLIDSNFLTGAKGGTIKITPAKQIDISNPDIDKYNNKIDDNIKNVEKDAGQISADVAKNEGVSQVALANKIKEALDKLKQEQENLKIQKIETKNNPLANDCAALEAKYNEILAFYTAHEKEKKFNLPPPPEADYLDCWTCDKQKQIDFDKKVEDYAEKFAKQEREYLGSCLEIMKTLQLDIYTGTNATNNAACAVNGTKIPTILFWLMGRRGKMCKQLLNDYRKNYKTVIPVMKVCLMSDKDANLLGAPESGMLYDLASLPRLVRDTLMKQLTKQKDYTMLSEVPLMVLMDKDYSLLSGNSDAEFLNDIIYSIGRFKLTVEMDIKMGKDGGYIIAHLKGKSNMIFELDSTDCLHIVPDWRESLNSGLADKWNSVSMNVIALEMITPKGAPPKYIGTKTYRSTFPKIKLNFCRQGGDSIYLQTFNPDPGGYGTWLYVIPKAPPQRVPSGLMGVDRIFMDIADIENEAQQIKTPPPADEAALKEIERLAADIQKNGATAAKMKKIQDLTQKSMQQAQETSLPLSNFKFAVSFQNKNAVLIDQTYDAKKINPQLAEEIVYGYFKIKLEDASHKN